MGLLSWLNRSGQEILSPTVVDPGFKRAENAEKGAAPGATVVGLEQKLDDGTTKRFVAVDVRTAGEARTGGVEVTHGPAHVLARLRLGVEVLVRHSDGDAVVLDWPAMCAGWGVSDEPGQKRRRKPPGSGVTDQAVDWADQRRLEKWTPRRIPFYAAWLAAPGAEVPVAVDPKDPGKAVVDWAAAANEPGRSPGRLDDPPPDGSAAALLAP